ncbi:non-homologous end joining protein Ku [Olivibacter domesticus]|uniref:Non-homologous end joining protein Ku n=1 Tax=Olivibacter domesticus TaxID=407022 RepID=A0A1H7I3C4_OLID1|nr:Ku protein [Olivibacter domesticus]SEK56918.1 DNA end-binding protein Ku [Olivibacter domesticus]
MRAIWTGAIGFGLVNIPIKLFSATEESRLDFDMLDRKDHAKIRYQRVNENTGKEVPWENIVKGYMLNDNYIVLEDTDFEEASPEKNKMINIQSFVKEKEVDSMYFETPYYIEPQKGGQKAYHLLVKALEKAGMAGLATFVMRAGENLCMIRARENMLVLNKLRFEEEIRSPEELNIPANIKLTKAELDMALELVKHHSTSFDVSAYKDEYKDELVKIIKARAKGKRPKVRKLKVKATRTNDLLEQLKASLG